MAASRNLAEYYHWEETARGIRIYMHSAMADRLQAEILRAAEGGTEAGGILLGRMEEDRGRPLAVIDDFVPVPATRHHGPLYALSEEDTPNLESALLRTALAGCESPDAPSILGYYRSHMRDGLWLSPDDLVVIDSYFQAPASVFLLIKTLAGTKACTAGFFFWEDGRIESEFSSLEVALGRAPALPLPLSPAVLPVSGDVPDLQADLEEDLPADLAALFRNAALPEPSVAPAMPATPAAMREPEPSYQPPVAIAAPPAHARQMPAWQGYLFRAGSVSIATLALVISVVTYLGAPRPPREEAAVSIPAASALGLLAEQSHKGLLVTWNGNVREIVSARRATLSIRDGKVETSVDLDKTKLAAGSYLFRPASGDIQLRLEVYGADEGSVAQSIRVSVGRPSATR